MGGPGVPPPADSLGSPARDRADVDVRLRPARLGDIGALVRMYRGQGADTARLYHPFPFDRLRLGVIFLYMVATRPLVGWLLRHVPRRAVLLLVAEIGPDRTIAGFGNTGFRRTPTEPRAIFGYMVDARFRGLGIGTRLHEEMIEEALRLGVRRGGGMVVVDNAANLRILKRMGFSMRASEVVDRAAPGVRNIETDGDLEEIAAGWRHRRPAASRADPGATAPP